MLKKFLIICSIVLLGVTTSSATYSSNGNNWNSTSYSYSSANAGSCSKYKSWANKYLNTYYTYCNYRDYRSYLYYNKKYKQCKKSVPVKCIKHKRLANQYLNAYYSSGYYGYYRYYQYYLKRYKQCKPTGALDTTKPTISLNGSATLNLKAGDAYEELATANDSKDGDITSKIVRTVTLHTDKVSRYFTLTYNVKDAAGNNADTKIRTIIVKKTEVPDTIKPIITLNGAATLNLKVGATYIESNSFR